MVARKKDTFIKRYIVTEDLYHLMERWRLDAHSNWERFDPLFFSKLSDSLIRDLQNIAFPDRLGNEFLIRVERKRREGEPDLCRRKDDTDSFWIALDRVYVQDENEDEGRDIQGARRPRIEYLDITRMFDRDGEKLAIGLRPENEARNQPYTSVDTRIGHIRDAYRAAGCPTNVILADDGTYTGGSVKWVIERLIAKNIDVKVREIRLAFATKKGEDEIRKLCDSGIRGGHGEILDVAYKIHHSHSTQGVHDWVCERDFYLGAPRSGRTVGQLHGKDTDPLPVRPAISHPYVHGFGNVLEGGSIRKGRFELGSRLIDAAVNLWSYIESVAKRPILVSDLPRFPGPGVRTASLTLGPLRAVDYFEQMRELVYGNAKFGAEYEDLESASSA